MNILYDRAISFPIDFVKDDYLYVLTRRQLLKINTENLDLVDRLPLPYQFNYMLLTPLYVGLISSNEIVMIERQNMSYRNSIGLEPGDNRALIKNYPEVRLSGSQIFLCRDSETKTVLMVIESQTGEIKRKTTVAKILSTCYSPVERHFFFFDVSRQIHVYDQNLHKLSSRKTGIFAGKIHNDRDRLIIAGEEYLSLFSNEGKIYDFQPIPKTAVTDIDVMALVYNKRIFLFDPLTVRPMKTSIDDRWINIIDIDDPDYFVALDTLKDFYIVSNPDMKINRLPIRKPLPQISSPPTILDQTSYWYIQTGAFTSSDNAENMQRLIQQKDIPAVIEKTDLYRVKIGGFSDKETARHFIEGFDLAGWLVFQPKIASTENILFSLNSENYRYNNGVITKEQP